MGFDDVRRRPDRAAGPLAPAARRDRDHPRPRRPGDGRGAGLPAAARPRRSTCSRCSPRPMPAPPRPKAWSSWRVRADPRPVPPRQGRAHQWRRAAAGGQRARWTVPKEVRRGGVSITVEPVDDGSRVTVIAPDRVGLLADVAAMFALQRIGSPRGPGLVAGPVRRLVLGGRRGARGRRGAAAALRRDPGGPPRPGARGWRRPPASGWPRPSSYAPRPRRRPRCSRCGPPTGPAWSTWSAPRWPGSTSRSARPTSTPSARRRSTCSTCRRRAAGALSDVRAAEAAHAVRDALTR